MYKVFIENREVLFVNSQKNEETTAGISEDDLAYSHADLVNYLRHNPSIDSFSIYCGDVQKTWNRHFENFQFIHAAGGVVTKNGEWLFIEREGRIDLPKGHLESNEDSVVGAAREIAEECGIYPLHFVAPICTTHHTYVYNETQVLKKTDWYLFNYPGNQFGEPQIEEGIDAVHWLKLDEISAAYGNMFRSIQSVVDSTKDVMHQFGFL
jgi:8-oxo-dGTP pyrophosphatase MutT (NUDIX family)